MKNPKRERLFIMKRQYHRSHQWRLSDDGLYIPHSYEHRKPDDLSLSDDFGFILNRRRVMVWWQHPRCAYHAAIEAQSRVEAADGSRDNWLFEGGTKNYRKVPAQRRHHP